MLTNRTFEECYLEIESIVERKRYDWTFKASLMEDFDDVKSEILTHIWKKWEMFDQTRSLGGWVSIIVKNQFANKLRNVYQSISSPCLKCACNIGGGSCSLYGEQGEDCSLFKKWYHKQRYAHDVKQPLPIENHSTEVRNRVDESYNLSNSINELHKKMKDKLTTSEFAVYDILYIQNLSESEAIKILGFKEDSGGKGRCKRIRQIKTTIIKKTKNLLQQNGMNGYL